MTTHGECPVCDRGYLSGERIEWVGSDEPSSLTLLRADGTALAFTHSVPCEEQATCTVCGQPQPLRTGTGYWTERDWELEQDATVLVWDGDRDADGRQVVEIPGLPSPHGAGWRLVEGRIVPAWPAEAHNPSDEQDTDQIRTGYKWWVVRTPIPDEAATEDELRQYREIAEALIQQLTDADVSVRYHDWPEATIETLDQTNYYSQGPVDREIAEILGRAFETWLRTLGA